MIGRALGRVVVCGCLMAGASLQAHHSLAGVYDMKAEKEIAGTLTTIKFVNPHGSMTITTKNPDGTTTDWTFTTGSATALADRGISKVGPHALKIGEELTVTFTPARNGSPLGGLKTIKRTDGTVLGNTGGRRPGSRTRSWWSRPRGAALHPGTRCERPEGSPVQLGLVHGHAAEQ